MYRLRQIMTWLVVCVAPLLATAMAEDAPKSKKPAPYAAEMSKKFTEL